MTKAQIQAELADAKEMLKVAEDASEKDFAKKEVAKWEEKLKNFKEPAPSKKEEPKKHAPPAKKEMTTIDGKEYEKGSDEECAALLKQVEERKKAAKKAGKKYKTTSISSKIGKNITDVVSKAIDSVPLDTIRKAPAQFASNVKHAEQAANDFFESLKKLLGDEYDKGDFKEELAEIKAIVEKIKAKAKK